MSADMFTTNPTHQMSTTPVKSPENSRIPLPSPTPLRRYGSLRLRGEYLNGPTSPDNITPNPSRPINETKVIGRGSRHQENVGQSVGDAPLKRGYSFMEKGEKKYGDRPGMASRPQSIKPGIKTDRNGGLVGVKQLTTPQSPNRIRSLSLSLSNTRLNSPKSPSAFSISSPKSPADSIRNNVHDSHNLLDYRGVDWDDTESVTSIGGSSVASCEHASVARNGTTFSGRSMKYIFHCNQHSGVTGEEYLTPTQRAHRQVKKLKYLLHQAKKDLEQRDSDILKLTKEVVELRLYKAALSSPEDKSNSSDAVTVRENTSEETSPEKDVLDADMCPLEPNHIGVVHSDMNNSFADSGHFEDCTNSSVHSKDSILFDDGIRSPFKVTHVETSEKGITARFDSFDHDSEHSKLIMEYEKRLQELVRTHEEESYQLKQKHNDKVEELLQRITEINSRYWELVPELETARDRIRELEVQLEEASKKLQEQEDKHKQTYLQMYNKGQEAARLEHENRVMELAHQHPSRISVPELLQELQVTKNELENIKDVEYASTSKSSQPLLSAKEALSLWVLGARKAMYRQLMEAKSKNKIDPEITLQFLKSAVYYFLTDRENSQGHLKAIQSILGFSSNEIDNIDKARLQ